MFLAKRWDNITLIIERVSTKYMYRSARIEIRPSHYLFFFSGLILNFNTQLHGVFGCVVADTHYHGLLDARVGDKNDTCHP